MIKQSTSCRNINALGTTHSSQTKKQGSSPLHNTPLSNTAASLAKSLIEVTPETERSAKRVTPQLNDVESCLNAMIAVFDALSKIHAAKNYHGNPTEEKVVFHETCHAGSKISSLRASFIDFQSTPETVRSSRPAQNDVRIVMQEFGGRLLLTAEKNDYRNLNILKTHLESQINFADQGDDLESAATMHEHLCALKILLSVRKRDYSNLELANPPWGPLKAKEVSRVFPTAYAETGRPPLKKGVGQLC
jgi:hypothetical protein